MSVYTQEKTERLLAALLESPSLKHAAQQCGIPYGTARRLIAAPEAKERLAELQEQATSAALLASMHLSELARTALEALLANPATPQYVLVRCIQIALSYEQALKEGDAMDDKLAELEKLLEEQTSQDTQGYIPAGYR